MDELWSERTICCGWIYYDQRGYVGGREGGITTDEQCRGERLGGHKSGQMKRFRTQDLSISVVIAIYQVESPSLVDCMA